MKFLRYPNSRWVETAHACPRDGEPIYQEVTEDGEIIKWFRCGRDGCTWPDYNEDKLFAEVEEIQSVNHLDKFRRTGRTTRMLKYAIEQANAGKTVIIYAHTAQLRAHLIKMAWQIEEPDNPNYTRNLAQLPYGPGLMKIRIIDETFDWRVLGSRGIPHDVIQLVDHWAIEQEFPAICRMIYRFIEEK